TVHRHRTFESDVTHHLRWRGDVEHAILPRALPTDDFADTVNVPSHEMSAELAGGTQWPLKIHERTDLRELQVGAPPCLLKQIELRGLEFSPRGNLYCGQATAVHR